MMALSTGDGASTVVGVTAGALSTGPFSIGALIDMGLWEAISFERLSGTIGGCSVCGCVYVVRSEHSYGRETPSHYGNLDS